MPAASSRRASLSVARSAETAAEAPAPVRAPGPWPRARAVLPEPGEPIRFRARTPASTKCSRLWRAARSLPARIFSCSSTGTSSGSPQPQVVHIRAPPSRSSRARSRPSRRRGPRALPQAGQRSTAPRAMGRRHARAAPARLHLPHLQGRARAEGAGAERVVGGPEELRVHAGELADLHRHAVDRHGAGARGPRPRRGRRALWIREYSCMGKGSPSADPRERLALELGEQPPAEAGVEDDGAGPLGDGRADGGGVPPERVGAERGEDALRRRRGARR